MTDAVPVQAALRAAAEMLKDVSDAPRLDAELLMAHAYGCSRSELLLRGGGQTAPENFAELVARRMRHEPVAYITGSQDFWDLTLSVTPDVLIPRGDSETLIDMAVAAFAGRNGALRILDLGTGSGALLLAALSALPSATGVGIDASKSALAVAAYNAEQLGFDNRALFHAINWRDQDWYAALGGNFDLILCNPPYIGDKEALSPMVAHYEPHSALFAGTDGLDDYRILIPQITDMLAPDGVAIFEIGHTQAQAVSNLARKAGLSSEMRRDLGGNPRALRFLLGIASGNG